MKKLAALFTLFIVCFCGFKAKAQYYFYNGNYYDNPVVFELGLSLNAMNCLTDLGGKKGIGARYLKDLNIGKTHIAGGVFGAVTYKSLLAIRLEYTRGNISADDKVLEGITDIAKERYNRNLNFRSNISEIAGIIEVHPLFLGVDYSEDEVPPLLSPYLFAGIGQFKFNPEGEIPNSGGNWTSLQPLHTEGQGFPQHPDRPNYKLKQLNFPVGFGARYELGGIFNLRLEAMYRILQTDYLDDVSTRYINPAEFLTNLPPAEAALALQMHDKQRVKITNPNGGSKRGSPSEKDAYFTINLKLGLVLGRKGR